jgi:D-mannonate dehydratase
VNDGITFCTGSLGAAYLAGVFEAVQKDLKK